MRKASWHFHGKSVFCHYLENPVAYFFGNAQIMFVSNLNNLRSGTNTSVKEDLPHSAYQRALPAPCSSMLLHYPLQEAPEKGAGMGTAALPWTAALAEPAPKPGTEPTISVCWVLPRGQ